MSGLWGEAYDISSAEKEKTKKIAKKAKKGLNLNPDNQKDLDKLLANKNVELKVKLDLIKKEVTRVLGNKFKDVDILTTRQELNDYINDSLKNGIISIDTETNNNKDPLTSELMGLCLYTPGRKTCYFPVNHVNPDTNERLSNQITELDVYEELKVIETTKIKTILQNGKFDYQVLKCVCKKKLNKILEIPIYWDTMICARLLNENEQSAGLKYQYTTKIDKAQEYYSIEGLFNTVPYAQIDPQYFGIYAGMDPLMTFKLYEWQSNQFKEDVTLNKVYDLFMNVEMLIVTISAEMELDGVCLDKEYAKKLEDKYTKLTTTLNESILNDIKALQSQIDAWKLTKEANERPKKEITKDAYIKATSKSKKVNPMLIEENGHYFRLGKSKVEQLEDPIKLSSSTQLAILLYDILKCPEVNHKTPRSVDKNTLPLIAKATNLHFLNTLLEKKKVDTLLADFIIKLPQMVGEDGKLHCHFNQLGQEEDGVVTGRFSCSDPNLQQIPSKNKEIRMMFRASPGYTLIGSDFSSQEPRLLAFYSQDPEMIKAFEAGKDLYATIAMRVYDNNYEDNLEFRADGSEYPEGKKRRSNCKQLLLGIMYQMGASHLAESIKKSREEAQKIIDDFYKGFPAVRKWMDKTIEFCHTNGFVEDWKGRRRRLPNVQLPKYEVKYFDEKKNITKMFNPFLNCKDRPCEQKELQEYLERCKRCRSISDLNVLKKTAAMKGILIEDNGSYISKAERQSINARIQGGAATMTKVAMIKLHNNKELKQLGFRLLIGVHDELIGECPIENKDRVAELLTSIMKTSIADICNVPFKCDADICERWYYNDYCAEIRKEHRHLVSGDEKEGIKPISKEEATQRIIESHTETPEKELLTILNK